MIRRGDRRGKLDEAGRPGITWVPVGGGHLTRRIVASATNKQKVFAIRTPLILVGVILLLSGLIFMGQGSGYFPYPAESFMVRASQWIYYGGGIAVIGVVLLVIAWR
ncbi:MAG TPA: hypothetical protein VHD86_14825 [Xanthobacteraceae bacterium]|nr:hypothetical protein [Xanthobacteraceae bacterium]